jgi:hypothetical protein
MSKLQAIGSVLKRPYYIGISLFVAALIFTASTILIPNWSLVTQIIGAETMTISQQAAVLINLYGSIATNFTTFSATVTLLLSLLVGVNLALFVYAVRNSAATQSGTAGTTSVSGIIGGLLGIGCAACGSLLVTAALPGFLGAAVTTLPFGGEEIGVLGLILVGVSIYYLSRNIATPAGTCAV